MPRLKPRRRSLPRKPPPILNNLAVRTLSGIGFVLIVLAGLLVDKFLFAALVLFVMVISMHEFYKMTIGEGYRTQRILAIVTARGHP